MSTLRFSAHCERGHDPVDFTDPAAFEAHMMGEHGARKPQPGGQLHKRYGYLANGRTALPAAPGWSGGKPAAPTPWKAPKAPATTEKLTAVLVKADERHYAVRGHDGLDPDWYTDEKVSPTELRAGDAFILEGHRYTVVQTDPERGHLLRLESGREGWVTEYRYRNYRNEGQPVETVTLVERAA